MSNWNSLKLLTWFSNPEISITETMSRILDFLFFITWRTACASRKGVSFLTRLYHIGHLHSETAVENATKGSILTSELKNA